MIELTHKNTWMATHYGLNSKEKKQREFGPDELQQACEWYNSLCKREYYKVTPEQFMQGYRHETEDGEAAEDSPFLYYCRYFRGIGYSAAQAASLAKWIA